MKSTTKLFAGVLLAGFVGAAHALPITDTYAPDSPVTLVTGTPYSYAHDLLVHGFNPALDTLASATLTLNIGGADGQPISVSLDGSPAFGGTLSALLGGLTVDLAFLQNDGLLNITLTKGGGAGSRFSFISSTLLAQGAASSDEPGGPAVPAASLPEPGTLALIGLGLLGGLLARRRKG